MKFVQHLKTLDNSRFFLLFNFLHETEASIIFRTACRCCRMSFPHFKHVDRVIVVSQPALTREVKLTFLTLIQEYSPLTGLNGQVDADFGHVLLDRLTDLHVGLRVIRQISDVDRVLDDSMPLSSNS